jgi:hypothetical protein
VMHRALVAAVLFAVAQSARAEDRTHFGLQAALGIEQRLSPKPSQGIRIGFLQGQVLTRLVGSPGHERLQLVNELVVGESLTTSKRFLVGSAALFRFHGYSGRQISVFADIGAGVASSALHIEPKNSGWMQYILSGGAGIRFRPGGTARVSYILEYRLTHMSNHDTHDPNAGLDMNTIAIGINIH